MEIVLFLDDDLDRHSHFRARMTARIAKAAAGHADERRVLYAFTAAEAIAALRAHEGEIAEAFLDHDLCVEDQCIEPGAPSKVPTGMVVVDHILAMQRPPRSVTVHSFNTRAAMVMCARLDKLAGVAVRRIPFSRLLSRLG